MSHVTKRNQKPFDFLKFNWGFSATLPRNPPPDTQSGGACGPHRLHLLLTTQRRRRCPSFGSAVSWHWTVVKLIIFPRWCCELRRNLLWLFAVLLCVYIYIYISCVLFCKLCRNLNGDKCTRDKHPIIRATLLPSVWAPHVFFFSFIFQNDAACCPRWASLILERPAHLGQQAASKCSTASPMWRNQHLESVLSLSSPSRLRGSTAFCSTSPPLVLGGVYFLYLHSDLMENIHA